MNDSQTREESRVEISDSSGNEKTEVITIRISKSLLFYLLVSCFILVTVFFPSSHRMDGIQLYGLQIFRGRFWFCLLLRKIVVFLNLLVCVVLLFWKDSISRKKKEATATIFGILALMGLFQSVWCLDSFYFRPRQKQLVNIEDIFSKDRLSEVGAEEFRKYFFLKQVAILFSEVKAYNSFLAKQTGEIYGIEEGPKRFLKAFLPMRGVFSEVSGFFHYLFWQWAILYFLFRWTIVGNRHRDSTSPAGSFIVGGS